MANEESNKSRAGYHHGDLRRAIRDEAIDVIGSEGLEAVSLRAIARRLGVSEAAPYHHYSGKAELLAVIAADAYRGLHDRMEQALESAGVDPFERLQALGRAYIEYGLESRGRFRLMFGEHMVDLASHDEVFRAGRPTRVMLSDVVAACLDRDVSDPSAIENSVWAMVHGLTWLMVETEIRPEDEDIEVDRLVDTALAILASGIKAMTAW
jgi:AcrR family transcriptional regulator